MLFGKNQLIYLIGLTLTMACAKDEHTAGTPPNIAPGPASFSMDYRTSNNFFTNMPEARLGTSPHRLSRIWYSSNVSGLLNNANFEVHEGTVAIKEFDNNGTPGIDGIAVMIKKAKGYDSPNNNWHYEMRSAQGAAMIDPAPGRIQMCISCHVHGRSTDFLLGTQLR